MTVPISVLVQTKNEESAIGRCLQSLQAFDEVVVVDSNSVDRTADIARSWGARVVSFTWGGAYPKKKQWQLENVSTRNDWILLLDADERPTDRLVEELRSRFSGSIVESAFDIELLYWFAGTPLQYGHRVVKRALVQRATATFPEFDDLGLPGSWEVEGHYQPHIVGKVGKLTSKLEHRDPDPVSSWIERHNRYSTWEAHIRTRQGLRAKMRSSKSTQGKLFDRLPFQPVVFFIYSYLLRRGFLDGRAGFDYAIGLSMYYWQIELKGRELVMAARG